MPGALKTPGFESTACFFRSVVPPCLASVLALSGIFLAAEVSAQTPSPASVLRIDAPPDITGSISSDGKLLSYTDWSTGDVALWQLLTGESRRLTRKGSWFESAAHGFPSITSPDGRHVAYSWMTHEGTRELRAISTAGGEPRVLLRSGSQLIEPKDWSPDQSNILIAAEAADGSAVLALLSLRDQSFTPIGTFPSYDIHLTRIAFDPSGSYIAYDRPAGDSQSRDVFRMSISDGRVERLGGHPATEVFLGWSGNGDVLLARQNGESSRWSVWRLPFDDRDKPAVPQLLVENVAPIGRSLGTTGDSTIYLGHYQWRNHLYVARLDEDRSGLESVERIAELGADAGASWSPDGRWLAYVTGFGYSPNPYVLHVRAAENGTVRTIPLRFGAHPFRVSWSPDSRSVVAHHENRRGRHAIHSIDIQTGNVTPVVPLAPCCFEWPTWAADGRVFFLRSTESSSRAVSTVVALDPRTGREDEVYSLVAPTRVENISQIAVAPDGQHLAFVWSDWQAGVTALRTLTLPQGEERELVRATGPEEITAIAWMPDSKAIVYGTASAGDSKSHLWRVTISSRSSELLGTLQEPSIYDVSVHPDGRRVVLGAGTRGWRDVVSVVKYPPRR